jgi:hypothetical protein
VHAIAVEVAANGAEVIVIDIAGPVSPASNAAPATQQDLDATCDSFTMSLAKPFDLRRLKRTSAILPGCERPPSISKRNLKDRHRGGRRRHSAVETVAGNGLLLSAIVVGLMLYTGWIGGELVFSHRMAVNNRPDL